MVSLAIVRGYHRVAVIEGALRHLRLAALYFLLCMVPLTCLLVACRVVACQMSAGSGHAPEAHPSTAMRSGSWNPGGSPPAGACCRPRFHTPCDAIRDHPCAHARLFFYYGDRAYTPLALCMCLCMRILLYRCYCCCSRCWSRCWSRCCFCCCCCCSRPRHSASGEVQCPDIAT
jgi:hypothetical protein